MKSDKYDRRVKYTKMILRQSLLELMKDRSISTISVTDICKKADINRGTFYSHYSDPYDLLLQLENELYDDISKMIQNYSKAAETFTTYGVTLEIFECVAANSDVCSILLGKNGDPVFVKKIISIAQAQCFNIWAKKIGPQDDALYAYLYNFISNGSVGVIQLWIEGGMKEPPNKVAKIVDTLANNALDNFSVK